MKPTNIHITRNDNIIMFVHYKKNDGYHKLNHIIYKYLDIIFNIKSSIKFR